LLRRKKREKREKFADFREVDDRAEDYLERYERRHTRVKSERPKREKKVHEQAVSVIAKDSRSQVSVAEMSRREQERWRERRPAVQEAFRRDVREKERSANVSQVGRNQTVSFHHTTKDKHQFFTRKSEKIGKRVNLMTSAQQLPWNRSQHPHHQSPSLLQGTGAANLSRVTPQHGAGKWNPAVTANPDVNGTLLWLNVLTRYTQRQSPRATVSAHQAANYRKAERQMEARENKYARNISVVNIRP